MILGIELSFARLLLELARLKDTLPMTMDLMCPSCARKHRVEDYPEAFEIPCPCGYSILVPDLKQLASQERTKVTVDPSVAVAVEEEDQKFLIEDPNILAGGEAEALAQSDVAVEASLAMTAPDELPQGMVYDPFELPNVDNQNVPSDSVGQSEPEAQLSETAGGLPYATNAPSHLQEVLVQTQLANMGQILGRSFDLELKNLQPEVLEWIRQRLLELIGQRAWLRAELENRGIELESSAPLNSLKRVPELVAIEIYLACVEAGGHCEYRLSK